MKILYPHGDTTVGEIEEVLRLSIEGRKRVKDQIVRIDHTISPVMFGYTDASGDWHEVTTLEEDEYPSYYHRVVERDPEEKIDRVAKRVAGTGIAEPAPFALQPDHREFQENQRGVSYEKIILPYLAGAREMVITDPYIRVFRQARNLMELMELIESIAKAKAPGDEISITLKTIEHEEPGKARTQRESLIAIREAVQSLKRLRLGPPRWWLGWWMTWRLGEARVAGLG